MSLGGQIRGLGGGGGYLRAPPLLYETLTGVWHLVTLPEGTISYPASGGGGGVGIPPGGLPVIMSGEVATQFAAGRGGNRG